MRKCHIQMVIILLLLPTVAMALESLNIVVLGLSRDHAVLQINGKQQLLRTGQTSAEGVTLIDANSDSAILQRNGKSQAYPLGSQFGGVMPPPTSLPTVTLWPTNGMYQTSGQINGYQVNFLVDTGASAIALNAATASRLGIDFRRAPQVGVKTASGEEVAYEVTLNQVQLGEIVLNNIRALVIDGEEPARALLGMSFLNQLDMKRQGDRLDLIKKFR